MTAKVKRQHSLLWKSLMTAQNLIEKCMRWRVGNEEQINIWEDKWLPSRLTFQVQSPKKILPSIAIVNELLVERGTEWNVNLIQSIFWEEETKAILSIPVGQFQREDKLIWAMIEKGIFTIKSAYFLVLNLFKGESKGAPSNTEAQTRNWKFICD